MQSDATDSLTTYPESWSAYNVNTHSYTLVTFPHTYRRGGVPYGAHILSQTQLIITDRTVPAVLSVISISEGLISEGLYPNM